MLLPCLNLCWCSTFVSYLWCFLVGGFCVFSLPNFSCYFFLCFSVFFSLFSSFVFSKVVLCVFFLTCCSVSLICFSIHSVSYYGMDCKLVLWVVVLGCCDILFQFARVVIASLACAFLAIEFLSVGCCCRFRHLHLLRPTSSAGSLRRCGFSSRFKRTNVKTCPLLSH